MTTSRLAQRVAGAGLLALSGAAVAHTGHDHGVAGLMAGLTHPLGGTDHLLAMVTVGLWSAAAFPAGRRAWVPAAFVAALALGALVAHGAPGPVGATPLELLIAASVVLLGVLLVLARRLPVAAGLAITVAAGLAHGLAHGLEAVGDVSFAAYVAGFVLASGALHATGLAAGAWLLRGRDWAWRTAGVLVGVSGIVMLLSRI